MSLDVYLHATDLDGNKIQVFDANITSNLGKMAIEAGIYKVLWDPEEIGVTRAGDIVECLGNSLTDMKERPEHYKQFDPPNGWGSYEDFVPWIEAYLEACKKYPSAEIGIWK